MTVRDRLFEASERMRRESAQDAEGSMPAAATETPVVNRAEAARELRELAAMLSNGGAVLVRYVGTPEARVDAEITDRLLDIAQLIDGKTLEQAAAEIE